MTYEPYDEPHSGFWWTSPNGNENEVTTSDHNLTPEVAQLGTETHNRANETPGGYDNKDTIGGASTWYPAGVGGSWHSSQQDMSVSKRPSWARTNPDSGYTATAIRPGTVPVPANDDSLCIGSVLKSGRLGAVVAFLRRVRLRERI